MLKTRGMVIFFIAAGTVLFILTYFFTYASVNGAATVSQNKPIEIELNNADRLTMDLQRANVIFYKNKDNRILITYEPGLYESVPDYETMKPQVKYSKNELQIKMRSSDHIPTINIYIPSSLKHVTVLHEEGSLLFNDDCTYGLTVEGKKSEVKINYIRSLLNINVAEGNVTVLKGFLPKGSGIKVKIGNIRLCALLDDEIIPQDLGFVDRTNPDKMFEPEVQFVVGKKELSSIVERCIKKHGIAKTAEVLDGIKELGFKYSTRGAITIGITDMEIPAIKKDLLAQAEAEIDKVGRQFKRGLISEEERYKSVIDIWTRTNDTLTEALMENLGRFNPLYMMSTSGARGQVKQIKQLAAMRGLMSDTTGKTVEIPIRSSFREGLNVLEFFISSHGARKGLADTALRTADSGYLTRRLVDVSQDVIVTEKDCGSEDGIEVKAIMDGKEVIESLEERIVGRFTAKDVVHPETGEVLVKKGVMISDQDADRIKKAGISKVLVRSVLTCNTRHGVCARCYGINLATATEVDIGEAVGIIAAQSIGEPGTQLTMRTFHTGGVAGSDITQGLPRVEELFEARKPKGLAIVSEIAGRVEIHETKKKRDVIVTNPEGDSRSYSIPYGSRLKVSDGDWIEAGDEITEGSVNPHDILKIKGARGVQEYLAHEVQKVYRLQGVDINDKHIEVIVRQMMRKVKVENPGDTDMLPGSLVDIFEFWDQNKLMESKGLEPATGSRVLLGITKASLAMDSFLSAASFQETTRVLTDAAIKGKVDPLVGLKENVIIGKLIPAGTGMKRYKEIDIDYEGKTEQIIPIDEKAYKEALKQSSQSFLDDYALDGGEKTGKKTYFVQEDEDTEDLVDEDYDLDDEEEDIDESSDQDFDLLLDEDEDLSLDSNLDLDLGFEDDDEYDLSDDDFSDEDDEF
jgi:hypothetical protein